MLILIALAIYFVLVAFVAGCFAAASGFRVEEDNPEWLREVGEPPTTIHIRRDVP